MDEIKILKKNKNALLPKKATPGSAGWDLHACINEKIKINPGELVKVPTGIAIALPSGNLVSLIFARSGLAIKNGITLSNGVGVVDSDYRGEIQVGLCNISKKAFEINPNDRIAQMVVMPVYNASLTFCDELDETFRGEGGLGSTGK